VKPLSVAVIGTGHLGSLHAKMFSQIGSAVLTGVFDVVAERAAAIASEVGTKAF